MGNATMHLIVMQIHLKCLCFLITMICTGILTSDNVPMNSTFNKCWRFTRNYSGHTNMSATVSQRLLNWHKTGGGQYAIQQWQRIILQCWDWIDTQVFWSLAVEVADAFSVRKRQKEVRNFSLKLSNIDVLIWRVTNSSLCSLDTEASSLTPREYRRVLRSIRGWPVTLELWLITLNSFRNHLEKNEAMPSHMKNAYQKLLVKCICPYNKQVCFLKPPILESNFYNFKFMCKNYLALKEVIKNDSLFNAFSTCVHLDSVEIRQN